MNAGLKVVDLEFDSLCVEKIFIDATGELRAKVSGLECSVGTNEALVGAGVVMFQPIDTRRARQHPVFTKLNVTGVLNDFWCIAADPRLVNAAARFNVLKHREHAVSPQELWPGEQGLP